jgi:hypothetical protein
MDSLKPIAWARCFSGVISRTVAFKAGSRPFPRSSDGFPMASPTLRPYRGWPTVRSGKPGCAPLLLCKRAQPAPTDRRPNRCSAFSVHHGPLLHIGQSGDLAIGQVANPLCLALITGLAFRGCSKL